MPPHWFEHIVAPKKRSETKRHRWKILREGHLIEDHLSPLSFSRSWSVRRVAGTEQSGAIKYVLESTHQADRCEMVVLFPRGKRATVCVSSQIGCGVGCVFCATGSMGFVRNLSYVEILEQVYLARREAIANDRHLRNVVFMGMGEPLHNLDQVMESLRWIISDEAFGISPRGVTVSTSGAPSAMLDLVDRFPNVRLAWSLHATQADQRRSLMPRCPNDLLGFKSTIQKINAKQKGIPLWIEYLMLESVNDTQQHARELADFCDGLHVEVNLIPYNATDTHLRFTGTSREHRESFAGILRDRGVVTTIRQSFGNSDDAACGQLVTIGRKE